jgi:hypothetical protein
VTDGLVDGPKADAGPGAAALAFGGGQGEVTARSLWRMAQRQSLMLVKHRVRDTRALNYRCYMLAGRSALRCAKRR